jgi:hypothetical protein
MSGAAGGGGGGAADGWLPTCETWLGWGMAVCEQHARERLVSKTAVKHVARFIFLMLKFIFSCGF